MPNSYVSGFSRPLVLGHRGAPRVATENTLVSLAEAVKLGADGVELDVQRAADGVPVVIHDDELKRTMGVRGKVSALRWEAIQRLSRARVPSLEQAVAWAVASGAWLNIELKSPGVEAAVLDLVTKAKIADRSVISSFDADSVRRAGEVDPSITRYYLTERWDDAAMKEHAFSTASGVCLHIDAARTSTLERLRSAEIPVIVWTVNDPTTMRRLLLEGVAGIITDLPGVAVRVRQECGR